MSQPQDQETDWMAEDVRAPIYDPVPDWVSPTDCLSFSGDATSVAVDPNDDIYVFNRGSRPVVKLDTAGAVLSTWGIGEFIRPHAIKLTPDGHLLLVDEGSHAVELRTIDGSRITRIESMGGEAELQSGVPFNRPTDAAQHPVTREIYVSDGYGNSRVHRYSPEGKYIASWGRPGTGPGEFSLPHGLCFLSDEVLAVCDRENFRIQLFSLEGDYLDQWHFHRPSAIAASSVGQQMLYVTELGPHAIQRGTAGLGNMVQVLLPDGSRLQPIGDGTSGGGTRQFVAAHGVAVDSHGDVYIAEVAGTYYRNIGVQPDGAEPVSLRKWRRSDRV